MSRRTRHLMNRARSITATLPLPSPKKQPLPPLCPGNTHIWRFVDRVQLSLVDTSLGGYALASYIHCINCVAIVEFLGICNAQDGTTQVNSSWLLLPDGRGWELPLPAQRTIVIPQG